MPKYLIFAAVVIVIIIVNVIRIALKSSRHHFECPNCGEHFQVGFSKRFFTMHSLDGKYNITCPKCRKTNMLKSLSGKK